MAALCITVGASTLADLRARRDRAAAEADLVEVRLDTVADPDVAGALADRPGPVVVTCRPVREGGQFRGSEEERLRLLAEAWHAGAEFVDMEWDAWGNAAWIAGTRGDRLIVSSHDFERVPDDLRARHRAMRTTGAAVVKIAVTAQRLADCLALQPLAAARQRQVLLAMGAPGLVTRVLPDRFGSCWTYAGDAWAPGQVPAARLREEFRFGRVSDAPRVFGLVANPTGHSVSPAMHNAAFAAAGLDAVYMPLQASDAGDFLAFANGFGIEGASVTTPFKVDLLDACRPDALAAEVGAVNTLVRRADGWAGHNTDVEGLLAPLAGRVTLPGCRVAVLGSGGAARAAAVAFRRAGARVTVHARKAEAAAAIAAATAVTAAPMPPAPGSWDVLVNATSAGMHPDENATPWPGARFDGQLVYDLIYNPSQTRLLREAQDAGCATLGGLDMLVAQAAAQFRLWTGLAPDPHVMRAAAETRLAAFRIAAGPSPVART